MRGASPTNSAADLRRDVQMQIDVLGLRAGFEQVRRSVAHGLRQVERLGA